MVSIAPRFTHTQFLPMPSKVTPPRTPAGDDQLHSACVMGFEIIIDGGVPDLLFGPLRLAVADSRGACQFGTHAPLGDVGMVAAPVGDLAAGVIENPTKVDEATGGGVGRFGGGTEPHLVVEAVRDRLGILTVAGVAQVRRTARGVRHGRFQACRCRRCEQSRRPCGSVRLSAAGCRIGRPDCWT